jgi:hypothetical protein
MTTPHRTGKAAAGQRCQQPSRVEGYAGVHFGADETTPAPATVTRRNDGDTSTLACICLSHLRTE